MRWDGRAADRAVGAARLPRRPRDARIEQSSGPDGIERDAAQQRLEREDKARIDYVRRAYGVDGLDPELYHRMLDSTAVPLDTCVELIVVAARARLGQPRETARRGGSDAGTTRYTDP